METNSHRLKRGGPAGSLRRRVGLLAALAALGVWNSSGIGAPGQSSAPAESATNPPSSSSLETLVERIKPSIVVINHFGHDGNVDGVGTGFVVSEDGLIATCLHVIGEARPVAVRLADGRRFEASEIHAFDRKLDLAILRIPAQGLKALTLGDPEQIRSGASVVAIGNPFGLEMSVVEGVVSGVREIENQRMIQLAMPIEPGNSGGPLVDRFGRVQGVLTLKSLLTPNLGFAMPVSDLKALLAKPNRVTMERWLVIGALDPTEWKPVMGARWSQKPGIVMVDGRGQGWGGRALCLRQAPPLQLPFDLQTWVKLDDESGAAGLAFGSDGGQRHMGFYPTAGRLRLTRFDGPDVSDWNILHDVQTEFYRPGGWNLLKIRVETNTMACFINGHEIFRTANTRLAGGQFGLCKFRDTKASFKKFISGSALPDEAKPASEELAALIEKAAAGTTTRSEQQAARDLQAHADEGRALLMERARNLEAQAARIRRIAVEAHRQSVAMELARSLQLPENQINLFRDTLLIARLDDPELDVDAYEGQVNRMGRELQASLPKEATPEEKLKAIRRFLFEENGFHMSGHDDFDRANCRMNDVLDDRAGWPIMLSVLYLELAARIHLDSVAGLPLPVKFLVAYRPAKGQEKIIDVTDGGREIDRKTAAAMAGATEDEPLPESAFGPATKKQIIIRVLNNLRTMAQRSGEAQEGLHYLDAILAVSPEAVPERLSRARMRIQAGDTAGAKEDYHWLIDHEPQGVDLDAIGRIYQSL